MKMQVQLFTRANTTVASNNTEKNSKSHINFGGIMGVFSNSPTSAAITQFQSRGKCVD